MRVIKFRAWSEDLKEMDYNPMNTISFDGKQVFFGVGEITGFFDSKMQYTGLKDKNGREIYESDVVDVESERCPFDKNWTGIVKMIDGSWVLENLEGMNGEYLFNETLEVEVIGNIHDNPELLEESS